MLLPEQAILFHDITQTSNPFHVATQTSNLFHVATQTSNLFHVATQTSNLFHNLPEQVIIPWYYLKKYFP